MRNRSVTYMTQETFAALADPTRRAMLELLRGGSLPAGEIARAFPVSRPAISRHLRLLRRARLVAERRNGRLRVYRLHPAPLRDVNSWLNRYRSFWQANLNSLKSFVETQVENEAPRPRAKAKSRAMK
jgi:DNA-binding transcriptional ArsR family regulator